MIIAIVPAYNEEKTIGSVIRDLFPYVDEVVVVDDCSKDNTAQVSQEAGATVLSHRVNRGQGAALETGHEYARRQRAAYVVHFDADGQFSAADIPGALSKITEAGADVLFGTRFLDDRSNIPFIKRYALLPFGKMVDWLMGAVPLTDVHNGFRILSGRALECVSIRHDRMAHATEIPVLVKACGLTYVEYPVKVVYHEYGQGMRGGVRILRDLFFGKFIK